MKAVGIDVGKAALDVAVHGDAAVRRFANTSAGIRKLMKTLIGLGELRIVVEATGGYEDAVLNACTQHGLWIARVNPHQARSFAKALGQLAKTDALDAHVLAEMAHALHTRIRAYTAQAPWQVELRGWLRRRHQITEAIQRTRQQCAMTLPAIRALMQKTLSALRREQTVIDRSLRQLLQLHGLDDKL